MILRLSWTGIRNYQARNFLKMMNKGETFLFYHSGGTTPAVTGVGIIMRESYPDPTQFNKKDSHFDPKATKEKPIWVTVDVSFKKKLDRPITLAEIKRNPALRNMPLVQSGSRLSIQPVLEKHIHFFT